MAEERAGGNHSWWLTLPGLLTGLAAVVTALSGLVAGLYQAGFFRAGGAAEQAATAPAVPPRPVTSEGVAPGLTPAPAAPAGSPPSAPPGAGPAGAARRVSLLSPERGGHLVAASSDDWQATIDGSEAGAQISWGVGKEAVYAFRDERPATFDLFTLLVLDSSYANVKEFELSAGNESPTGTFEPIGRFQAQNLKLFKTPYQEFPFPPVRARYFKVKILSAYGAHPWVHEFQLFGSIDGPP